MADIYCRVSDVCGGCPNINLERSDELKKKTKKVIEAFKSYGFDISSPTISYRRRINYRNRIRLQVIEGVADFYNQAKRDGCAVLSDALWEALNEIRSLSRLDPGIFFNISNIEVRVDDFGGKGLWVDSELIFDDRFDLLRETKWRLGSHSQSEFLKYRLVGEDTIEVATGSFVQINSEINSLIISQILKLASQYEVQSFIDLYAGSGNYSLPLINNNLTGVAVETNSASIFSLKKNIKSNNFKIINSNVESVISSLDSSDLVICNPPRAGIKQSYIYLNQLTNKLLIIVSCNPVTLAKDTNNLIDSGFKLEGIECFDMFPGTDHIETMAWFTKK